MTRALETSLCETYSPTSNSKSGTSILSLLLSGSSNQNRSQLQSASEQRAISGLTCIVSSESQNGQAGVPSGVYASSSLILHHQSEWTELIRSTRLIHHGRKDSTGTLTDISSNKDRILSQSQRHQVRCFHSRPSPALLGSL